MDIINPCGAPEGTWPPAVVWIVRVLQGEPVARWSLTTSRWLCWWRDMMWVSACTSVPPILMPVLPYAGSSRLAGPTWTPTCPHVSCGHCQELIAPKGLISSCNCGFWALGGIGCALFSSWAPGPCGALLPALTPAQGMGPWRAGSWWAACPTQGAGVQRSTLLARGLATVLWGWAGVHCLHSTPPVLAPGKCGAQLGPCYINTVYVHVNKQH